jgi:peroxiredoxin
MRKLIVASLITLGVAATFLTAAAPVPRPAKEFTIEAPSGNLLLSSYKGKVVMLAFMFTTCPHCQALSQVMTKMQGEMGPRGFQALGAVFNDEVQTLDPKVNMGVTSSFIRDYHVGFPVGRAPRESVMTYLGLSVMDHNWGVPQIMIIDRKGQIIVQSEGRGDNTVFLQHEDTLRTYLDGQLGSASSAGSKSGAAKKAGPAKPADKKTS